MTDVLEILRKLRPFYGKRMDELWKVYLMEDREGKTEIENTLQIMESNVLNESIEKNEPILVPPPENTIKGPIHIGDVVYAGKKLYPFGLHLKELTSHICITGATGRGKSNICMFLVENLLREDIKWCLFDFKRSVRDMLSDPVPYDRSIQIFTVGRNVVPFRYNPLIPPPGYDPRTWIDKILDIITKNQYAGFGVASLLRKAIDHVYSAVGMYDNGPLLKQPTLKDTLKYLNDYKPKGREINWMSSTLRSIEALCFGEMGEILNSEYPIDLKDILEMNAVFELDSLSNANKAFFIESILTYFHAFRLHQGGDEEFKHACIVEEAHRILKRSDRQGATHDSILDIWVTEARQLGECLVILGQTPSLFPAIALGNTYTTIALNLKHNSDINTMSKVLLLPNDQKDCLGRLRLGNAIVKLQGRWLSPFLIDVPLYLIQKGSVDDKKLIKLMEPYFTNSNSKKALNDLSGRFQASPGIDKYNRVINDNTDEQFIKNKLTEIEKNMILDIINNPGSSVVTRYERLNLSRRKGNNSKLVLRFNELIREIPIITKKGKVVLVELTKKGRELLRVIDDSYNHYNRKRTGGAVHEYWKEQIAKYYVDRGYKVIKEKPVNGGKTVDISIENNGKKIAIEIETGKSDAIWNIKKDLEAGFDEVVSVAVDEAVYKKLRTQVLKTYSYHKNVRIVDVDSFF